MKSKMFAKNLPNIASNCKTEQENAHKPKKAKQPKDERFQKILNQKFDDLMQEAIQGESVTKTRKRMKASSMDHSLEESVKKSPNVEQTGNQKEKEVKFPEIHRKPKHKPKERSRHPRYRTLKANRSTIIQNLKASDSTANISHPNEDIRGKKVRSQLK